jgi:tRNA pseudouridine55 synthase
MARRRPSLVHGIVAVDKPAAMTSHDVVARARRELNERRIGHTGTLDPDATGVLLLGVGNATRLGRFLTALPKTYTTEIVFGTTTDTLDDSGVVTGTFDMAPTLDEVTAAAARLTGAIQQVPPMVSALKVDGRRLHELAREGIEIERQARPVDVYRYEVTPTADPLIWQAEVVCGSGTYVRVLAADLGELLGGGAHLRTLRRTRIGSFAAESCDQLGALQLLTMTEGLRDLDAIEIPGDDVRRVMNGGWLDPEPAGAGPWRLVDPDGQLLAVHERGSDGRVRPGVVLPAE